jgi:hypothetical protein
MMVFRAKGRREPWSKWRRGEWTDVVRASKRSRVVEVRDAGLVVEEVEANFGLTGGRTA